VYKKLNDSIGSIDIKNAFYEDLEIETYNDILLIENFNNFLKKKIERPRVYLDKKGVEKNLTNRPRIPKNYEKLFKEAKKNRRK
jgi:hypothetical protein